MYTVQQITALTTTHISVLLSDDVAYDVDRGAFEEYVMEHGEYVMCDGKIPVDVYWDNMKVNDNPHKFDLTDYISHSKSTQLDIDVVRALDNCKEQIHKITREFISREYADAHMHTDMASLKMMIGIYGTAIKNQITYQNK